MYSPTVLNLIFVSIFASLANCEEVYFWRPWTAGFPPSDAVTGRDYRGVSYIVEAYAPGYGLFIGQALANQQQVSISALHVNPRDIIQKGHALKVLCSQNQDRLSWYPTKYSNVANQVLSGTITPVVGGLNVKDDVLYIGRYVDTSLSTVHFGSICQKYHHLHYYHNKRDVAQNYYEILTVETKHNLKDSTSIQLESENLD